MNVPLPPAEPAEPRLSVDKNCISVRLRERDGIGVVARRLLRSSDVRSVMFDKEKVEATVRLRRQADAGKMLGEIALLAGSQSAALTKSTSALRMAEEVIQWNDHLTGSDNYVRAPRQAKGLVRVAFLLGAALMFLLAAIGAVVPGLPTTPFLLLTSYFLVRSSRKLHGRLLDSRVFGRFLKDWHVYRAVRPGVKTVALTTMTLAVGGSVVLSGLPVGMLLGIVALAGVGATVVWRLPVIEH